MQLNNLGLDFLQKRNSYIKNTKVRDVNKIARELLHSDELSVISVGGNE